MKERDIEAFWHAHPCGDAQVGGLRQFAGDYEAFFTAYDQFRYRKESHIPRCLDGIGFANRQVLEIGLGEGAESEQMIRRGAAWSGIDLTRESVERVRARLLLRGLPHLRLEQASALSIPWGDNSFDVVFSHGVLHHVPDIGRAQREIWRVLKPDGELIVMLYARWSLNYLLSISVLRRLGLAAMYVTGWDPGGIYGQHLANARADGLLEYLRMQRFIHRNTDGPINPYSKVYDLASVRRDFPLFHVTRAYKRFMHAPPLPVGALPLERWLGWHLWVHMKPVPQ